MTDKERLLRANAYKRYQKYLKKYQQLKQLIGDDVFQFSYYSEENFNKKYTMLFNINLNKKYRDIDYFLEMYERDSDMFQKEAEKFKENRIKYGSHYSLNIYDMQF
jgi:hypothetical protein